MSRLSKLPRGIQYIAISSISIITVLLMLIALNKLFDSDLVVAVITAATTVLVSVFSLVWQRRTEKQEAIEQQIRDKKTPHYEKLLELAFSLLFASKNSNEEQKEKLLSPSKSRNAQLSDVRIDPNAQLQKLIPDLISWADESVLNAWVNFRQVAKVSKDRPADVLFAFEELMHLIRKDLGHDDKRYKKGDLLRINFDEIEKYL